MADNNLTTKEEFLLNPVEEHNITDAAIASFETNLKHPLKVTVPITPIQDLHGMPNPYPAGASVNLIPDTTDTSNGYVAGQHLNVDGTTTANASWYISEYITLDAETTYTWSNRVNTSIAVSICFYDENKEFISGINANGQYSHTFTPPEGAVYARSSQTTYAYQEASSSNGAFQLEVGSTATTYRRYSNICPIEGFSDVSIDQRQKNLVVPDNPQNPMQNYTHTSTGTVLYSSEYDAFYCSGYGIAEDKRGGAYSTLFAAPHDMTVTFSIDTYNVGTDYGIRFYAKGPRVTDIHGTRNTWSHYSYTVTLSKGQKLQLSYYGSIYWKNLQVVVGTSADQYYPYVANTFPITFTDPSTGDPMTVYGGSLTLNEDGSADLVSNREYVKNVNYSVSGRRIRFALHNKVSWTVGISNIFHGAINSSDTSNWSYHVASTGTASVYYAYVPSGYTAEQIAEIMQQAEFLTPQYNKTYHFPNVGQLKAFLGTNNVWSDIGNVDVKYLTQHSETGLEYRGDRALELRRRAMMADAPTIHMTVGSEETGGLASFKSYVKAPVKKIEIPFEPVQEGTGDPSPDNVRPISGWTGANISHAEKNLLGGINLANRLAVVYGNTYMNYDDKTLRFPYSGYAANIDALGVKFKENTQYTFILALANSQIERSNMTIVYTDGSVTYVPDSVATTESIKVVVSTAGKTVRGLGKKQSGGTTYVYYDDSGIFEGVLTAADFSPYVGQTLPINWQNDAGTIYGGTITLNPDGSADVVSTMGNIASYDSETFPGAWISSMDVYAEGTTPTTGAQVVYELATPETYHFSNLDQLKVWLGENNFWCDISDDITVKYWNRG